MEEHLNFKDFRPLLSSTPIERAQTSTRNQIGNKQTTEKCLRPKKLSELIIPIQSNPINLRESQREIGTQNNNIDLNPLNKTVFALSTESTCFDTHLMHNEDENLGHNAIDETVSSRTNTLLDFVKPMIEDIKPAVENLQSNFNLFQFTVNGSSSIDSIQNIKIENSQIIKEEPFRVRDTVESNSSQNYSIISVKSDDTTIVEMCEPKKSEVKIEPNGNNEPNESTIVEVREELSTDELENDTDSNIPNKMWCEEYKNQQSTVGKEPQKSKIVEVSMQSNVDSNKVIKETFKENVKPKSTHILGKVKCEKRSIGVVGNDFETNFLHKKPRKENKEPKPIIGEDPRRLLFEEVIISPHTNHVDLTVANPEPQFQNEKQKCTNGEDTQNGVLESYTSDFIPNDTAPKIAKRKLRQRVNEQDLRRSNRVRFPPINRWLLYKKMYEKIMQPYWKRVERRAHEKKVERMRQRRSGKK